MSDTQGSQAIGVMRELTNDTFVDVFDAFDRAAAATRLGWPVIFVGRCEVYDRWLVWVSAPCDPDEARTILDAAQVSPKLAP